LPRGSAPGERRGGRVAGTPNKHTSAVRSIAVKYGPSAVALLAEMAGLTPGTRAEAEAVRVSAAKEILDRAYGKSTQYIAGEDGGAVLVRITIDDARAEE
jgi:hypothetical protein